MRPILLVNTNVARPPIAPLGLEYVCEAVANAHLPLEVLDLSFEPDLKGALQKRLKDCEPLAVGLSVRNTDDCSFVSRKSYLPWIADIVTEIKNLTSAPAFLGGAGFSTMPESVLQITKADFGIEGDGEEAAIALPGSLAKNEDITHLPNMVYWRNGEVARNPRADVDLRYLPKPHRRTFDNRRYEKLGAMVGIETKRGCSQRCIYCADPIAKGRSVRTRPPEIVVQELQDLVDQGIRWLHICDSEFNLPIEHARDICRAIVDAGLADKVSWYCYCSPTPFDRELAELMKHSGCAGINFGVDSLCDEQLRRLGRQHTSKDVGQLTELLHSEGLNYMFDLLVGGPEESEDTLRLTIDTALRLNVPLVGMAVGLRVYPHTPLAAAIAESPVQKALHPSPQQDPWEPLFYLSPLVGEDVFGLIEHLVGRDPRFLILAAPGREGNYNYCDDEMLCRLVESGSRGAYWDIIRRSRGI